MCEVKNSMTFVRRGGSSRGRSSRGRGRGRKGRGKPGSGRSDYDPLMSFSDF